MKNRIIIPLLFIFTLQQALAVPAKRKPFNRIQPDGSTVTLERHGDENLNWVTLRGTNQVMVREENGRWIKVSLDKAILAKGKNTNGANHGKRIAGINPVLTKGERHVPVFLVEFTDERFITGAVNESFNAFFNENNYGANGSVKDYFHDNSNGQFTPVFDIYGPVTLSSKRAFYGAPLLDENGNCTRKHSQPERALYEACMKYDNEIDFSNYDQDEDGTIDCALFIYAGHNKAENGPEDSIWPHCWNVRYSSDKEISNARFDGKSLGVYACTSELRGDEGTDMCGIGTICHEFAHTLGLPDFYDSDYEENGLCIALYNFSLMCNGMYVNDGKTPPSLNAEERLLLGWMKPEDIQTMKPGNTSFASITNNIAYRIETEIEDEYFLLECRDSKGWDRFLPGGLYIYHVDKSSVRTLGGKTPSELWSSQKNINAYGDHPCFYAVPAYSPNNLNCDAEAKCWVCPGSMYTTSFRPIDWNGKETNPVIHNISYEKGTVTITIPYTSLKETGYPVIKDAKRGEYKTGDTFAFSLENVPENTAKITWFLDNEPQTGSAILTSGPHTVSAELIYEDGSLETVNLAIKVK